MATVTATLIYDIGRMVATCAEDDEVLINAELYKAIGPAGPTPVHFMLATMAINDLDALHDRVTAIFIAG